MYNLYRADKLFFVFNIAFWLILSLFTTIKAGLFNQEEETYWMHIFSYTFTSGILWIVFSFVILRLALIFPFDKKKLLKFIVLHAFLAFGISALQRFSSMTFDYFIQSKFILINKFPTYSEYLGDHFLRRWIEGLLWYFLITIIIYSYIELRRNTKEEKAISKKGGLYFKKKGSSFLIPYATILFIKSESNYCLVYTEKEIFKLRNSLKALEQDSKDSEIIRIHNSFMINRTKILGYKHIQNGEYAFSLQGSSKSIFSTKSYRNEARNIIMNFSNKI